MFWRIAYKTVQMFLKRNVFVEGVEALESYKGVELALKNAKSLKTTEEIASKTLKGINRLVNKNILSLETRINNMSVSKTWWNTFKTRQINKFGSKMFGELFYCLEYGIIDNFFWEHPILDALAHYQDKDKWSFLGQWLTIYKLPPVFRTAIKMVWNRHESISEKILDRIDRKLEEIQTEYEVKYIEQQLKLLKKESAREDAEWIECLIGMTDVEEVEIICFYIKRYMEMMDQERQTICKRMLKSLWNKYTNQRNEMRLKMTILCNWLEITDIKTISFRPNSPQTGNFMWCDYLLEKKVLRIYINNVWYAKHKSYYDFDCSYTNCCRALASRNFGNLYHNVFNLSQIHKPKKTYKKTNFNGSKV